MFLKLFKFVKMRRKQTQTRTFLFMLPKIVTFAIQTGHICNIPLTASCCGKSVGLLSNVIVRFLCQVLSYNGLNWTL
jgi:hypothetical protein